MSFQLNAVLQQAESIDHFDALKHCLLSCDLSLDLSDMTIEQNKQRRGLSHSKLKGHQYLVQLADVQIHPTYVFAPLISNYFLNLQHEQVLRLIELRWSQYKRNHRSLILG